MRRSEIASLLWESIDLNRRTTHLPVTKTDSPRTVPLSSVATAILQSRKDGEHVPPFYITANAFTRAFRRSIQRARTRYEANCHDLSQPDDSSISPFFVASVTSQNGRIQVRDLRQTISHAEPNLRLKKPISPSLRPRTSPPAEDRFRLCTRCRTSKRQQIATALERRSFRPSWASRHMERIPEARCSRGPSTAAQGRTATIRTLSRS